MKRTLLRFFSTILALAGCLIISAETDAFATTGPNTGEYCAAYIEACDGTKAGLEFDGISDGMKVYFKDPEDFEGLDYDKKTNTLTMTNFKGDYIIANEMGDDFAIKLVGDNYLNGITVYGYAYGGSVTFTGTGKLYAEKIWLYAEETKTVFDVTDKASVILNCVNYEHTLDDPTFAIIGTFSDKGLKAKASVDMVVDTHSLYLTDTANLFGYEDNYIVAKKGGETYYLVSETDTDYEGYTYVVEYIMFDKEGNTIETFENGEAIDKSDYVFETVDCYDIYSAEQKITFTASGVKAAPKKGDIITADGAKYKVTTEGTADKKGAVAFNAPKEDATKVTIPASIKVDGITFNVTSISASAFSGNKKVTEITIGKNVKTINKKAFYNCSKLKTLKISTTKLTDKTVKTDAFKKVNTACKITVPSGKADAYKKILRAAGLDKSVSVE